jgi:hypothetical protein
MLVTPGGRCAAAAAATAAAAAVQVVDIPELEEEGKEDITRMVRQQTQCATAQQHWCAANLTDACRNAHHLTTQ